MPHRNTIRHFTENGIYHVYNRGVEKRNIFMDEQDYAVFLHLLKYFLLPPSTGEVHPLLQFQNFSIRKSYPLKTMFEEIDLMVFCLMPNHFHLLIKQIFKDGITKFMRKLATTYAMYFNKRHNRIGYLFQGKYKAALVENDSYLLHVSRYIHLNPIDLQGSVPSHYPYSSYKYYLGEKHAKWLKTKIILDYFDTGKLQPFLKRYPSYQEFIEGQNCDSANIIGNLTLE